MKRNLYLLIFCALFAFSSGNAFSFLEEKVVTPEIEVATENVEVVIVPTSGILAVVVKSVRSTKGHILVGLYNNWVSFNNYQKEDPFMKKVVLPVTANTVVLFPNVPYGNYALKIFHDKNDDRTLNIGKFFVPLEHYGFSNDPLILFGPPRYDDCRFSFDQKHPTFNIRLK